MFKQNHYLKKNCICLMFCKFYQVPPRLLSIAKTGTVAKYQRIKGFFHIPSTFFCISLINLKYTFKNNKKNPFFCLEILFIKVTKGFINKHNANLSIT